jgi:hypothetical protein
MLGPTISLAANVLSERMATVGLYVCVYGLGKYHWLSLWHAWKVRHSQASGAQKSFVFISE